MSSDYTKTYEGAFTGSMRDNPPYTRLLFQAMCIKADPDGVAHGTVGFWAGFVNCSEADIEEGLQILSSPDPDSTTPDEEGRRIMKFGEGKNRWRIVNYIKFYKKSRDEDRAAYKLEWDRQNRAKGTQNDDNPTASDKSDISDPERKGKETERKGTEIEKSKPKEKPQRKIIPPEREWVLEYAEVIGLPQTEAAGFFDHFTSSGWKLSNGNAMKDWQSSMNRWKANQGKFGGSGPKSLRTRRDELMEGTG